MIGRSPECDLVINNHFISRRHAELVQDSNGQLLLRDLGSSNGTGIGSITNQVQDSPLQEMDLVFFSEDYPVPGGVLMRHFHHWLHSNGTARSSLTLGDVKVFGQGVIRIGSSPECEVCLPVLGIAHEHVSVFYDNGWQVADLAGDAFLNGEEIGNRTMALESGSVIEVESEAVSLTFSQQQMIIARQRSGFALEADQLSLTVKDRTTGEPRNLLSDISVSVLPGELVALMGPSGSGKTTLLNILAGISSASRGEVKYDGVPVAAGDIRATSHTGYVPQDDLLYGELTVAESLYYSTRYRVPDSVSNEQIKRKVAEVCEVLGLDERIRGTLIGSPEKKTLSGGQRKRVNLAMELVTDPLILFLDEPTSGLSSRDTRVVVDALRDLASSMSIAVIVTIHQPSLKVYQTFDKVLYLKDGKLVYYGNAFPDGVSYFIHDEAPEVAGADAVMEALEDRHAHDAALDYTRSSAFQKFVQQRAQLLSVMHHSDLGLPAARASESWFSQVIHASLRYGKCRIRDWQALLIQIMQGPLVGALLGIGLASVRVNTPLFLFVFVAIWFGTNNTARELVSERTLFRREKRSGAAVGAMLLSKLSMNSLVTLIQCVLLVLMASLFLDLTLNLGLAIGVCWLASLVGISLGLLISALAKTDVAAIVITPLVLIPFILFGGLLAPIDDLKAGPKAITQLMPTRWGYEALVHAEKISHETTEEEKTNPFKTFIEFRADDADSGNGRRTRKIISCMSVLFGQFTLFFSMVWIRVKLKSY
ncbi:ABC transporter ATP-binding protein [Oceaniferula spumae]|uniref:ABC transporter ATP-binding protein n=1 Tax=Oceaniferula spumae TaxID=2979115 RepID=A0AAT9FLN5_9BACT